MENMSEIAGTGFFFARLPNGEFKFMQGMEDDGIELSPQDFAESFGTSVENPDARKQAAGILDEFNKRSRMQVSLAPFQDMTEGAPEQATQEMNAQMGSFLGG